TEVYLVADQQIGCPRLAQGDDIRRFVARVPSRESFTQQVRFPFGDIWGRHVVVFHRLRLGRASDIDTSGERLESRRADCGELSRRAGEGDDMPRGLGGAGNGDKRIEVTAAALEGEENTHGTPIPINYYCTIAAIFAGS